MDSRYDTQAAHRAWIRRHEHSCRDDACGWCEDEAEERARERDTTFPLPPRRTRRGRREATNKKRGEPPQPLQGKRLAVTERKYRR